MSFSPCGGRPFPPTADPPLFLAGGPIGPQGIGGDPPCLTSHLSRCAGTSSPTPPKDVSVLGRAEAEKGGGNRVHFARIQLYFRSRDLARAIGIYMGRKEVIGASVTMVQGAPALGEFAIESIGLGGPAKKTVKIEKKKSFFSSFQKETTRELTPEAQAVKNVCQKLRIGGAHVITAFNPFHIVTRYFEIPFVPLKEWPHVIRYEANRYVPFRMAETIADYNAVEQKKADGTRVVAVTVSATKTEHIRLFVQHLRAGGVKADVVEPAFIAFSRAVSAGKKLDERKIYGFIFIDADGSVNLTFARGRSVYLSRDFMLSEDQRENQTRFYEELTASINFLGRSVGGEQVEKVFLAGSGDLIFWTDFLTNTFRQDIKFEFGLFPTKQDISRNVLAALLVPIGLALRRLGTKTPLGELSLLPREESETKPERLKRVLIRQTLVLAVMFLGIRLIVFQPYLMYLEKEQRRWESRSMVLHGHVPTEPIGELETTRDELAKQLNHLSRILKNKVLFGKKLEALAKSIPEPIWLESVSYTAQDFGLLGEERRWQDSSEGKGLTLSGWCTADSAEAEVRAVNEWMNGLGKNDIFMDGLKSVKLEEIRREFRQGREMSRFRVVCA